MGKRSSFKRRPQDKYLTFDTRAGDALAPHLPDGVKYWEPCAAGRHLSNQIDSFGHECVVATDILPECETVYRLDALTATKKDVEQTGVSHIITNPVWSRITLHEMITHFSNMRPTWLLFDADWAHTKQSIPFMPRCEKIVSIGRLVWIEGTKTSGKDNCAWYLFDVNNTKQTKFYGRKDKR